MNELEQTIINSLTELTEQKDLAYVQNFARNSLGRVLLGDLIDEMTAEKSVDNTDESLNELTKQLVSTREENQKLKSQVEQLSRTMNSVDSTVNLMEEAKYERLLQDHKILKADYQIIETELKSLKDLRKVSDVLTNTNESLNEVEPVFGLEETVATEVKPTKKFRKFSNWVENYEDNLDGKVKAVVHVPKNAAYLPNQVIVELHEQ